MKLLRIVRMEFTPEDALDFDAYFATVRPEILEMEGCFQVVSLAGIDRPGLRTTLSIWESPEALDRYRRSDLFARVWPKTKEKFVSSPVAWSLDWQNNESSFESFAL